MNWIEKGHAGYQIFYDLTCTECDKVLYETYQSTPRVQVSETGDIKYVDKNRYKLFSKDSVSSLGVLLSIVSLQHGLQNALFETMSGILGLPTWSNDGIKSHKLAAAKILQSEGELSVAQAKEQEREYIKNHLYIYVPMTISEDGAQC